MELVRGSNLFDHIWCHAAEGAAGPDPVSPWDPTRTSGFDAGVVDESREASVGHAVRRGAGEPPIWGGCARHSGSWSAASTRSIGRASSIATSSHPTRWSMPRAGWCCSISLWWPIARRREGRRGAGRWTRHRRLHVAGAGAIGAAHHGVGLVQRGRGALRVADRSAPLPARPSRPRRTDRRLAPLDGGRGDPRPGSHGGAGGARLRTPPGSVTRSPAAGADLARGGGEQPAPR